MLAALFNIGLGAVLFAPECPNLTGRYRLNGEDGYVAITITQPNCQSITIDWMIYSYRDTTPGTHTLEVDGRFRRKQQWFGRTDSTWIAASWRGEHLEITSNEARDGSGPVSWELALGLTAKGNLCVGQRPGPTMRGQFADRVGGRPENSPDDPNCVAK